MIMSLMDPPPTRLPAAAAPPAPGPPRGSGPSLALPEDLCPDRWRAMGLWEDGREFLVTFGRGREDCRLRLDHALLEYDADDFERIETMWYEQFRPATAWRPSEWYPVEEIRLRRFKLLRAAGRLLPRRPPKDR